jgi:hypothetical protein
MFQSCENGDKVTGNVVHCKVGSMVVVRVVGDKHYESVPL